MIAYCGIICSECDAFIATQNDDDAKRKEVAALWTKESNVNVKPEDINCDGCLATTDRLWGYCHTCEIRKCGQEKGVENCAYCDEYPCYKLEKFFQRSGDRLGRLFPMAPMFRADLDEAREKIKKGEG